jgi:Na+-transporting NADH:ubiquinone oxidoreductase subunit A
MAEYKIRKGLDLPITGEPNQTITEGKQVDRVAIVAADFFGMKPKFLCQVGDQVKRGQPLFEDRKSPGVLFTSPGAGELIAINRGAKRALQSVVIQLNENERQNNLSEEDHHGFESYTGKQDLSADELEALLIESGMWTSIRQRPFSNVPKAGTRPDCLFLTCTETEPLGADINVVMQENEEDFELAVTALTKLSKKKTFLCAHPRTAVPTTMSDVSVELFSGKHPAGLAGTHIHMLYPASRSRVVWHIHLQDIIAIGKLIRTGKIDVERIVSLAGPTVTDPRLIRTRMGASTDILSAGEHPDNEHRVISGSALSGRKAMGDVHGFMGRFHRQITILEEDREKVFLGWLSPGANKFSTIPIFLSHMFGKKFKFTTTTHGEKREMVPIGMYERVMPLDIIPTFLLRAIEVGDLENAEKLGALELDEEDLALCSFVCPGKQNYGHHLRSLLDTIYREG